MATIANSTVAISPNCTLNVDVSMLVRMLDRCIVEVVKSQSSPLASVREADMVRFAAYINDLETFTDWAARMPQSDTPKSAPIQIQLDEPLPIPSIENDALWRLAQMLDKVKTARGEKVTDIEGLELDDEYERKSSLF